MQHRQTHALRAVFALSGLVIVAPPLRAETRSAIYVTRATCEMEGLLTAEECRNAFTNAEAEYNDAVPVFDQQADCEKEFRRCVISFAELSQPSTALRFAPKMKGIQVSVTSAKVRTVVPVLEGSHPAVRFDSRTILSVQDVRSPLKQQDAQTRWVAFQRQALAPKFIDWCKRFCEAFSKRDHPASGSSEPDTGLWSPRVDPGARSYASIETHRFSQRRPLAPANQPRFVPRSETGIHHQTVFKTVDADLP
jgi:Protein of unknown function (DUF1190)